MAPNCLWYQTQAIDLQIATRRRHDDWWIDHTNCSLRIYSLRHLNIVHYLHFLQSTPLRNRNSPLQNRETEILHLQTQLKQVTKDKIHLQGLIVDFKTEYTTYKMKTDK